MADLPELRSATHDDVPAIDALMMASGPDLDYLVGRSGDAVGRESH